MVGFNFAPTGWMVCEGQILPISDYQALFALIGTTYGGDGQSTFALPDLRGRIPFHRGSTLPLAQRGGTETVTLTTEQLPAHTHATVGTSAQGTQSAPAGATWAADDAVRQFASASASALVAMGAGAVGSTGGGQAHDNMPPFQAVNFVIAVFGMFPPRS